MRLAEGAVAAWLVQGFPVPMGMGCVLFCFTQPMGIAVLELPDLIAGAWL